MPARESLLDLALHLGEGFSKPSAEALLALPEIGPPSLRQAALLVGERRKGVGARARERSLEIAGALPKLTLNDGVELGLCPLDVILDIPTPCEPTAYCEGGDHGEEAGDETGRRNRELDSRPEGERDPAGRRRRHAHAGCPEERAFS